MTHRSTLASVPEEESSEKDRIGTLVKPGSKIDSDDFRKITQMAFVALLASTALRASQRKDILDHIGRISHSRPCRLLNSVAVTSYPCIVWSLFYQKSFSKMLMSNLLDAC